MITVVGLLFALGIGIMSGLAMAPSVKTAVKDRTEQMVKSLQDQFNKQNQQIQAGDRERDHHAKFATALFPWIIQGKLTGKRFALIQTGDYPDTARLTKEILEEAGATVSSVTVIDHSFPTRVQTNSSKILPALLAGRPTLPNDASAVLTVIGMIVARGGPSGSQDLEPMENARLIRRDGDYTVANDYVVIVGGASLENDSRAESLDVPLVKLLRMEGKTVVEVEPETAAISYVPILRDSEISTIDNADTDMGRIALVLAFRAERGNYGVKGSASSGVLPSPQSPDDIRRSPGP